ncbi:hypothetical protein N0V88_002719 [Collariella sp. IMI 366227]|nr:hypothetical protein N0V88_002719 [Collariella sp. IMI 366227]
MESPYITSTTTPLKHHIKVHTTKDQAAAITIPGQPNSVLTRFEEDLYQELCRQHDRVNLFVTSKADEIARRLHHLSNQVHRLIVRCATSGRDRVSIKRQQRFAKYEEMLLQCGDDIKSLQRFVNAQNVAFRKILKKYRKWTGSSTLGTRFRDDVLSSLKSFTKLDFSRLQSQYNDLFETLHAALPEGTDGRITLKPPQQPPRPSSSQLSPNATIVAQEPQPAGYWNEYDHGSEAGDDHHTDDYAIYIDPNADSFPAFTTLAGFLTTPPQTHHLDLPPQQQPSTPDPERGPSSPNITNNHPPQLNTHPLPISSPTTSPRPQRTHHPNKHNSSPPPRPHTASTTASSQFSSPVLQPPTPGSRSGGRGVMPSAKGQAMVMVMVMVMDMTMTTAITSNSTWKRCSRCRETNSACSAGQPSHVLQQRICSWVWQGY